MESIVLLQADPNLRQAMVTMLELSGYSVDAAASANGGMALIHAETPDVLVTEIDLFGEATGYDLIQTIRSTPHLAHIAVIFVTKRIDRRERWEATRLGVDEYLTIPFTMDELEEAVQAALKRRSR